MSSSWRNTHLYFPWMCIWKEFHLTHTEMHWTYPVTGRVSKSSAPNVPTEIPGRCCSGPHTKEALCSRSLLPICRCNRPSRKHRLPHVRQKGSHFRGWEQWHIRHFYLWRRFSVRLRLWSWSVSGENNALSYNCRYSPGHIRPKSPFPCQNRRYSFPLFHWN